MESYEHQEPWKRVNVSYSANPATGPSDPEQPVYPLSCCPPWICPGRQLS